MYIFSVFLLASSFVLFYFVFVLEKGCSLAVGSIRCVASDEIKML